MIELTKLGGQKVLVNPDLIELVEDQVNAWILAGIDSDIKEMPIEEAKKLGAMALFGEKYGDVVRVVSVPSVSVEFCGGTHVDNTAKLGLFHIVTESSVAAGVRRIEAVTGSNVLDVLRAQQDTLSEVTQLIKANSPDDLVRRSGQLMGEIKSLKHDLETAEAKIASSQLGDILKNQEVIGTVTFVSAVFDGSDATTIRGLCDRCKDIMDPKMVVLLVGKNDNGVSFGCVAGSEAVKSGVNAGKLVKTACMAAGGNGGGRPDSAMGAGKDVSAVQKAIEEVKASLQ